MSDHVFKHYRQYRQVRRSIGTDIIDCKTCLLDDWSNERALELGGIKDGNKRAIQQPMTYGSTRSEIAFSIDVGMWSAADALSGRWWMTVVTSSLVTVANAGRLTPGGTSVKADGEFGRSCH